MASTSKPAQSEIQSDQRNVRPESRASHRRRPLRVLFIHRDTDAVDCCVQELEKAHFTVGADVVLTLAKCIEQLRFQSYDVVVAEYPSPSWNGSQALRLLDQTLQEVPEAIPRERSSRSARVRASRERRRAVGGSHREATTNREWNYVACHRYARSHATTARPSNGPRYQFSAWEKVSIVSLAS